MYYFICFVSCFFVDLVVLGGSMVVVGVPGVIP